MTDQPSKLGQPEPSNPPAESAPAIFGPEESPSYFASRDGAYRVPLTAPWPQESPTTLADPIVNADTARLHMPAATASDAIATADTARLRTPATSPDPISAEDTHRLRTPAASPLDPIANADTARLRMPAAVYTPLEAQATQIQMPIASPHSVAPRRSAPTPLAPVGGEFRLTLAAIGIIFALLGAGLLVASYNTAQANIQPERAVQNFCQDLQSRRYAAAYTLLSSSYTPKLSEAEFTHLSELQDQVDGKIRACPLATGLSFDLAFGTPQSHTSYVVTILRDQPHSGHIDVIWQGNNWKVDALEQSLTGTNIGPLLAVQTFCQAIMQADYATAYSTLSTRQQSLATEPVFADQFRLALGGPVKLNGCTMNYGTYTLEAGSASVTTTFNLTIAAASGSMTTRLVTVLKLAMENGAWKIDDFSLRP